MRCPQCDNETRVIDSRPQKDLTVRRIRECLECNFRFPTRERILLDTKEETISKFLGQIRKEKGFGVRQLARLVGCDPGYLDRCLQGKQEIAPLLGAKIAKVLGLAPKEIFRQIFIKRYPESDGFINELLPK